MTTLELLQQHPKTTSLIKDWYLDKLLKSIELATDVPDDFKEMMKAQPIDDSNIAKMIDGIPRSLFDFFDENKLYIFINYMDKEESLEFFYTFRNIDTNPVKLFSSRKEAELAAIEKSFEMLENNL